MTGKILTFYLCGEQFGIDIKLVKEINRKIRFTPVPGASSHIVGLFNMRGQVVTIFDLGRKLGRRDSCHYNNPTCIILKNWNQQSDYVGFLVDRPGDVVDVSQEWSEPLPANGSHTQARYLKEIIKTDNGLIMIIDPDRVFL